MSDKEIGLKVVKYFWMWHQTYFGSKVRLSWEEFLNRLLPDLKKRDIVLDGIGGGVREAEVSDSRIDSAMRSLALKSQGQIPSNPLVMFQYLSNEAVKINWVDAVLYTAKESVKDVAKGAQAIGDSLITTGKILNFLLPAILIFIVFAYVNSATGGAVSKTFKALKK